MKKSSLKALLAGTMVAGVISAPAFAADLDVEPEKEFVEVGSFRGSILLPGTGISFKVGGYAKGDLIYRFDDFSAGFGGINELSSNGGGIFGGVGGDRFRAHAAQTRLNFDARATTSIGSARAFIEGDFFSFDDSAGVNENASNSERFRLRHAFAEIGIDALGGSLLIGQNWTNFGDLGSYANTLDFNGPNAQVFIRQAQIRWTQPINDTFTLSVSAEN
ncbi:MAG: porin, partial [Pseudomonadota bacterium]